jgi:hypothetical protein
MLPAENFFGDENTHKGASGPSFKTQVTGDGSESQTGRHELKSFKGDRPMAEISKIPRPTRSTLHIVSITPWQALKIHGVLQYGFAFFCVKFSIYAFTLWLPLLLSELLGYSD